MTGRLGRRYARALFDLARQDDALTAYAEDLGRAVAAFEEPRLRPLLLSPVIALATRRATTKKVVEALTLAPIVRNLVLLLADRDRLAILPDISRWYDEFLDAALGRARVTIRSASPLSAAEQADLLELARRVTKRKEVVATTEVDPEILGGIVLDAAGTIYDGSLKAQLERLSKDMAEGGA